jgi:uncharacterized protein YjbJ (UPF0337 family)
MDTWRQSSTEVTLSLQVTTMVTATDSYEERIEGMQNDTRQDARTPNSAARDKAAGTMKEVGGHIKENLGALTGNKRMEAQGRKDQNAGASRRKKGTWKDRMKGWIDRR